MIFRRVRGSYTSMVKYYTEGHETPSNIRAREPDLYGKRLVNVHITNDQGSEYRFPAVLCGGEQGNSVVRCISTLTVAR